MTRPIGPRRPWLSIAPLFAFALCPVLGQLNQVMEVKLDALLDSTTIEWSSSGNEKACTCKLMCQTLPSCTAVSIHRDDFRNFSCNFTNYYFSVSDSLFRPMTSDFILIKPQYYCPSGFFSIQHYGCFLIELNPKSWSEASQFCQNLGAELFWATTPAELHIADYHMGEAGVIDWWVNAVGRKWVNTGRDAVMEEWYPGKPNGALSECIVMKQVSEHEYLLDDRNCGETDPFLCRKLST